MLAPSFRSGFQEIHGTRIDRVLVASTDHIPDLHADISRWTWGEDTTACPPIRWVYAYEEDPGMDIAIPDWLLTLCQIARNHYGCNWILLDPDGDIIDGVPTFEHSTTVSA